MSLPSRTFLFIRKVRINVYFCKKKKKKKRSCQNVLESFVMDVRQGHNSFSANPTKWSHSCNSVAVASELFECI